MKNRFFAFLLATFLFLPAVALAQLSLTTSGSTVTIDFDNTVAGVNNGAFAGSGFQPSPNAGQLNSNAWAMTGWSDGSLAFGGTQNSGDFARGNTTAAVTTGGVYALDDGGNRRFLIQPAASDWAPGTLTLRIQNNMGSPLRQIDIAYDLFVRDDQNRANSFNFSYSTDDASYTSVSSMDYTSPDTATNTFFLVDGSSPSRQIRIAGLDIPNGGFFYVRWSGNDVSGLGNRDEFALDNIAVTGFTNNLIAAGSYPNLHIVGDPSGDRPSLAGNITPANLTVFAAGALDGLDNQILGTGSMTIQGRLVTQREGGLSDNSNALFPSATFTLDSLSTIRYERPSGTQTVTGRNDYGNVEIASTSSKSLDGNALLRGSLRLVASTLNVGNNTLTFRSGNTPILRNGVNETGQLQFGTNATLQFGDATSQLGNAFTIPNNTFPSPPFLQNLSIRRNNSITLGNQNIFTNTLTLTSGIFIVANGGSSASGAIIVFTDSPTAITGGSSTSHIRGTLRRVVQSDVTTDGVSYFFPIADSTGTYRPATLQNIRTGSGLCSMQITAGSTGATTFNSTLLSIRAPHWLIEENDLPSNFISSTLELTASSLISGENLIGASDNNVSGTYSSIGGTVSGSTITSNAQALTLTASHLRYVAIGAFTAEPTVQASGISFSSVTASSFTINWTSGNGTNRMVVMRQGAPVTFTPVDGTTYTGINSVFSLASNQDANNNRIVFAGTGSSVNVSGLSGNTTYHVAIYEFNGTLSNNSANFLITSPPTASQTTVPNQPTQNVNTLVFSNFQTNALTLSWNVPTGDVGANRIVVVRLFSTTQVPPTDGVGYTPNTTFGSGDSTGTGNFVVYNGNTPNAVTVTGLSPETQYAFDIYEYNGSGATANYNPSGVSANRFTLKNEPLGGISTLSVSNITKTSVKLDWTLLGSSDSVIIFRRIGGTATFEPADGRAYSLGELDPSGWRVLTKLVGTATTFNATNLASGTLHHFRIYAFNQAAASAQTANYRTSSGVAENNATTSSGQVYEWNAGDGLWGAGSNWNPTGVPSDGDLAQFNNGGTYTVSNVPTTSIGAIEVDNNTQVTFITGTPAKTITLTGFGSGLGNGLNVNSGTLTLGGSNAIQLSIQSGNTGRIADSVVVSFNGSRVTSPDSAGIIVEIGGVVRANSAAGGLFGTAGTTSSVIFESGATYVHNSSGGNPFQTTAGIVRFLSGSNYRQFTNSGFAASGRTFGNLEFNLTGTLSPTGSNPMTINGTLTKNGTGTVNLNLTGGINITGNIVSNAGTLTFTPGSPSTITFNGTSAQEISAGSGTLTFGTNASVTLNNAAGLTLQRSITLQNTLTLTSGLLTTNGNLTLAASASVAGGNDNSYVVGSLSHIFNNTLTTRVYPFGSSSRYRPISIRGNTSSGTATMSGALFEEDANLRESITDPPNRVSLVRYYGFQVTGNQIEVDQVPLLRANVDDGVGTFLSNTSLRVATARTGTGWTLRNLESTPNTTTFPIDLIGEAGLSFDAPTDPDSVLFALGSTSNTDNPLPVELLAYTGESTIEGAVLQWQTASEVDNLGFTILKDGVELASFSDTPSLRGRGTTSEETRYRFVDSKVKVGDVHQYQLRQTDLNGTIHELGTVTLTITTAVAPREYSLSQNYPNPFNPTTVITYSLKESGDVKLELFDVLGRKVAVLVSAKQEAGSYTYSFNAARYGLSTGMYFYRLQSGGFVATKKMLLVK